MNSVYNGTWNVMTGFKPGKMQELAEQIANTQLEISAIQKEKSGNGLIKRSNYSLYYSRSNKSGQAGNAPPPPNAATCPLRLRGHSQTQHHFPEDQNPNYTTLKTSISFLM